ncbi:hypothetical protein EVAR_93028_1, partial [Eumeta japonica]
LSRVSLVFELLLAKKHQARRLFITDLQNSSAVCVNLSDEFCDGRPSPAVNNKSINAVRRMIVTDGPTWYVVTCLFTQIKSHLRGQRFSSPEEAIEECEIHISEVTREQ